MRAELTGTQALAQRLESLLLSPQDTRSVDDPRSDVAGVVEWFGAMQSQDLASGLWSLGARLPRLTRVDIEAALERREALRTWPMRGTVHLVPARDAHWMLDLMGRRALVGAAKRREYLGLSDATADHAVEVLGAALAGGGRMTRAGCLATLQEAGISCAGQRGYHLLRYASQRGVTCIAPDVAGEQTFVLLDDWVPDRVRLPRDEALATIAVRYVRSHGPTTRQDMAGWTGLQAADVKRGIAAAGDELETVLAEGREMIVAAAATAPPEVRRADDAVLALPGFDEYLLGFKDRSLMLDPVDLPAVIPGRNGVFQATLVRAGRVIGTWKRATGRGRTVVTAVPLRSWSSAVRLRVEQAFEPYARYLGQPVEVRFTDQA